MRTFFSQMLNQAQANFLQVKSPFLKGKKSFSRFKWRQNEATGLEGLLRTQRAQDS